MGVGPLQLSIGCCAYNITTSFLLVVHAQRWFFNLNGERLVLVRRWPNSILAPLGMPK